MDHFLSQSALDSASSQQQTGVSLCVSELWHDCRSPGRETERDREMCCGEHAFENAEIRGSLVQNASELFFPAFG